MLRVCGGNYFFQLGTKPNNKNSHDYPIVSPPVDLSIDTSKLSSYSIDRYHSVLITHDGIIRGTGCNKEGQISGSLEKKTYDHYTEFTIKDRQGRLCKPISAVCGSSYTLYLVSDPDRPNRSLLAYSFSEIQSDNPIILNTGDKNPIALFGSFSNAAAIDSDGSLILIPYTVRKSPNSPLESVFLPNKGEKVIGVACCQHFIVVLSSSGRVYKSDLPKINFVEVVELFGQGVVDVSGIYDHCFAVCKNGSVYGYGSNKYGSLAIGDGKEEVTKFTEIEALKKFKITAAYAGCDHSLFLTADEKVLACGDNSFGELFLNIDHQNKTKFSLPIETSITAGASFCIAGSRISAVFIGDPPPNCPNRRIKQEKLPLKRASSSKIEIKEKVKPIQSPDKLTTLKAEVDRLRIENTNLKTENENLSNRLSSLLNMNKQTSLQILDSETIESLRVIREISFGGSGKVVEVGKEEKYALKMMNPEETSVEKQRNFLGEYEKLNYLNHPNIIKTHGIFMSDEKNPLSILLEFCPTDISRAIKTDSLSPLELAKSIIQIAEAMRYVHAMQIIHRDIKPQNILIAQDGLIRVSDFGISKLMTTEEQSTAHGVGTQRFMAPEILNEEKYDQMVDVYSFGVLLYFMLSDGEMPKITVVQVGNGKKAPIPSNFTSFSQKLIDRCWNFDPKERPSFKEICTEIEKNDFAVVELDKPDVKTIKEFWKKHKLIIPPYKD